jgi:diguanylate cyclase (GGDEF)-like protein
MRDAPPATILIVDDEPIQSEILGQLLETDYEVLCANSGREALALMESYRPDLVLLDVMMADLDGYQVLSQAKQNPVTTNIPVIFITALGQYEAEARGLELGAIDYIAKPFNPTIVRMRVRNHLALKQARDELARLATTDGLTGLANRRRFDEALAGEIKRLTRTRAKLSLVLLDVDHFKLFNDLYGHLAGDQCLRLVGQTLKSALHRPADLSARYGGEEFACILPETDEYGAHPVAQAILQRIADLGIPHAESSTGAYVTASIGLVTTSCCPGLGAEAVVAAADADLYRAKQYGRNQVVASVLDTEPRV